MSFDQDAVDEVVRLLQPQIDELKAQINALSTQSGLTKPAGYNVNWPDGTSDTYNLVPSN